MLGVNRNTRVRRTSPLRWTTSDEPEITLLPSRTRALACPTLPPRFGSALVALPLLLSLSGLIACAPIVRPATFKGARNQITDTSLIGPFDGQIVDSTTGEPIQDAIVVGVWSYDRGDGFVAPSGSETLTIQTDDAGRYRIGRAPLRKRGKSLRLVSFHLLVYKRGYASYRSDAVLEGGTRRDFTGRHNRIELSKWRDRDSHAAHLLHLAPPREVARVSDWERSQANLDLYAALGGGESANPDSSAPFPLTPTPTGERWLDASALILPEDVAMRTGYDGEFVVEELTDFPRTDFYHGVLFRAEDRGESFDFSFRVWSQPSGGLDPVVQIFRDNLPVETSAEVTDETWVYEEPGSGYRGVAFVDREQDTGVLLSCGPEQCIDIDTAIILAKFIQGRLDKLDSIAATEPAPAVTEPGDSTDPEPSDSEAPEPGSEDPEPTQPRSEDLP